MEMEDALEIVEEAIPYYIPRGGDLEEAFTKVLEYSKTIWNNTDIQTIIRELHRKT